MNKDICDLTVAEREAVANVFILVRDLMVETYGTPLYGRYICTNMLTVRCRELPKDELPYIHAKDIIDLRIYYDDPRGFITAEKTVLGWLRRKADITTEQRYRIYCTPCLQYEYRIAWLTSLINECLGLPFDTCYIESI